METLHESPRNEELVEGYKSAIDTKINSQASKNDKFLSLYYRAWAEEIENPAVVDSLAELQEERQKRNIYHKPGYTLEFLLRIIQLQALIQDDRSYPDDYQTVDDWRTQIRSLTLTDNPYFLADARYRNIQTMIDRRYVNVKLGWLMLKDEVARKQGEDPGFPSVIDFGCSLNHGLKRLARHEEFPYTDEAIEVNIQQHDAGRAEILPDSGLSQILEEKHLKAPFTITEGIGLDSVDIRDSGQKFWVRANCYPGELWLPERLERFDELEKDIPDVRFGQADCDSSQQIEQHIPPGVQSDIVVLSTMLYMQNNDSARLKIIENAKRYATHYVMVIDSAEKDDSSPTGLFFPEEFYSPDRPFGYNFFVLDMSDQEAGFQKFFSYDNGRCLRIVPNLENEIVASAFGV